MERDLVRQNIHSYPLGYRRHVSPPDTAKNKTENSMTSRLATLRTCDIWIELIAYRPRTRNFFRQSYDSANGSLTTDGRLTHPSFPIPSSRCPTDSRQTAIPSQKFTILSILFNGYQHYLFIHLNDTNIPVRITYVYTRYTLLTLKVIRRVNR